MEVIAQQTNSLLASVALRGRVVFHAAAETEHGSQVAEELSGGLQLIYSVSALWAVPEEGLDTQRRMLLPLG